MTVTLLLNVELETRRNNQIDVTRDIEICGRGLVYTEDEVMPQAIKSIVKNLLL